LHCSSQDEHHRHHDTSQRCFRLFCATATTSADATPVVVMVGRVTLAAVTCRSSSNNNSGAPLADLVPDTHRRRSSRTKKA